MAITEVAFHSDAGSRASSLFLSAQIREIETCVIVFPDAVCVPSPTSSHFHDAILDWLHGTHNVCFQMSQTSPLAVVNYFPVLKQKMFLKLIIIVHSQRFLR